MCGIVAIKWTKSPPSSSLIDKGVEMLSQRGKDAWGFAIGTNGASMETLVFKEGSRIDLRNNKKKIIERVGKIKSSGWIFLHSRLATNGYCGLSDHNHPIEFEDIQLVHNGLIVEWPTETKPFIIESNTDSQNLAIVIAKIAPNQLENVLNRTVGEISAIWHKGSDNSIQMYTNVGGLYLENNFEYTLVSSEPIHSNSEPTKLPIRKISNL
jgi:glucosamine 6-phosphate synthetase-like amidotransferase/phosphosugar isomerase protein